MREKDITKGTFWQDGGRIADFLNVNVYGGEQKVRAEDVFELKDTVKTFLQGRGARHGVSRTADAAKEVRLAEGSFYLYLENQEKADYGMVERCGLLEAASYQEQRLRARQRHRQERDLKETEYLYSGQPGTVCQAAGGRL